MPQHATGRCNGAPHHHRNAAALVAALLVGITPALAHEVEGTSPSTGSVGAELVIDGSGFDASKRRPRVLLVPSASDPGENTRPIKLKVSSFDDGEIRAAIRRVSKRSSAGSYDLHVLVKGQPDVVVADAFELLGPQIVSSGPVADGAVDLQVRSFGSRGRRKASIGGRRAAVSSADLTGPDEWRVSLVVPRLADGVWPTTITTPAGTHTAPPSIEVSSGNKVALKSGATLSVSGLPHFQAKKKRVTTEIFERSLTGVVALQRHGARDRVLDVSIDGLADDLDPGQVLPLDEVSVEFSDSAAKDPDDENAWSSDANEEQDQLLVQVVSRNDSHFRLFVSGTLRRSVGEGDETIEVEGTLTAPVGELPPIVLPCAATLSATASVTRDFTTDPEDSKAVFERSRGQVVISAISRFGRANEVQFTLLLALDPRTAELPLTADGLETGLSTVALLDHPGGGAARAWQAIFSPTGPPTSVTVTEVELFAEEVAGFAGCIRGTFEGTLVRPDFGLPEEDWPRQTIRGSFDLPLEQTD